MRKSGKKTPSKSNIYQHLQKDEKQKELEYETFDQIIENLLLSRTVFTKIEADSFISRMNILLSKFLTILLYCDMI